VDCTIYGNSEEARQFVRELWIGALPFLSLTIIGKFHAIFRRPLFGQFEAIEFPRCEITAKNPIVHAVLWEAEDLWAASIELSYTQASCEWAVLDVIVVNFGCGARGSCLAV
jgi:hypothetical protein